MDDFVGVGCNLYANPLPQFRVVSGWAVGIEAEVKIWDDDVALSVVSLNEVVKKNESKAVERHPEMIYGRLHDVQLWMLYLSASYYH